MDVFEGPLSQDLGEERGEGVVYSVVLKRVRYGSQGLDHAHLRWVSQKVRAVQAGTLEKLVEHLAPEPRVMEVSHVYRTCFLCTYRSFADPERVVALLVRRYLSLARRPEDTETESHTKEVVQLGILSFLRLWLETYPGDLCAPPSHPHLDSLQPLIRGSCDLQKMVRSLKEKEDNGGGLSREELDSSIEQQHQRPSQSPLFSMSPEQFSASLTSEDARLFLAVSPPQCLDYSRTPKDTTNAPTVRACIHHFNRVSLVVIATVLGGVAPDARAFVIGQWIDIAHHCRLVKNFSSLRAIVCGLQSTAVHRLHRTWERVSHSKLRLFEELSELISADYNHQTSRDLLTREGTAKYADVSPRKGKQRSHSIVGVVPYLGTFLTDLTMIHSAYQDTTQDGLLNFEKFRKTFQLLAELMLYQKSAANYCFCSEDQFLCWLRHTHTSSPAEGYELSKQLEPAEDLRSNTLGVPSMPLAPMSPSRLRRGLRQIFNVKGSSVGDYAPPHSPSGSLTSSISARDLSSSSSSSSNGSNKQRFTRSSSSSPSTRRRGSTLIGSLFRTDEDLEAEEDEPDGDMASEEGVVQEVEGRVVRVAFANSDHCNYKSLKLGTGDKTYSIIQQSLAKLGIPGEAKAYDLYQVLGDKHQLIPQNANVFYALSSEHRPTLIIHRRT